MVLPIYICFLQRPRHAFRLAPRLSRRALRPGSEMDIFRIDEGGILRPAEAEKMRVWRRTMLVLIGFYIGFIYGIYAVLIFFNGIYAVLIGWNIAFNENGNDDFYGNIMFYHPDMGFSWTLINVFRIYRFNHEEYRYNNWYNNFSWFAIKGKWTGNGLGVGPHAGFRP